MHLINMKGEIKVQCCEDLVLISSFCKQLPQSGASKDWSSQVSGI